MMLTSLKSPIAVGWSSVRSPKGWLPTWLVNLIQKSWPLKTLNGIRNIVGKDFVGEMKLPPPE